MYGFSTLLASLALCALTSAIQVTTPDDTTVWRSGTSGQTVSWKAVSTDATSFVIRLVNQAGFLANSPVTLIANQSTGSANMVNSATVTYSSGAWPTGTAFQINLMSSSENNAAILAQSKMFNITSSGSSTSGSSTGAVPTTMSMSTSSMTPMTSGMSSTSTVVTMTSMSGTASSGSGDASGGIPNAVTTTAAASSASGFFAPSIVGMLLGAAGLVGFVALKTFDI